MKIGKPFPASLSVYGTHEGIRTSDLPLRRRSLYPAELHGHIDFFTAWVLYRSFSRLSTLKAVPGALSLSGAQTPPSSDQSD